MYYVLSSTFVLAYGFTKHHSYYEMVMNQERLLVWLLLWENGLSGEQEEGESEGREKKEEGFVLLSTGTVEHDAETKVDTHSESW